MTTESTSISAARRIGIGFVSGSAIAAALAVVLAQNADDLGVGILGEILGRDARLFNNRVELASGNPAALFGGVAFCLLLGALLLFFYPTVRRRDLSRLFLLWLLLHLFRQAFFQAAMVPFDGDSNLSLALAEYDLPAGIDLVIGAAGAVGLLLLALGAAAAFLSYASLHRLINEPQRRFWFVLWLAVVPGIAGSFLALPFLLPDAGSGVIAGLPLVGLFTVATLLAAPGTATVRGPDEQQVREFSYGLLAFAILVFAVEQFILAGGVDVNPTNWG